MAVRISSNTTSQITAARPDAGAAVARTRSTRVQQSGGDQTRVRRSQGRMDSTRLAVARAQAKEVEGQIREKVLNRVDVLVQGMEALAQRISSDKVSSSQRSVLVSQFNDLERQVNRLDGIVGSEGRETQGQETLGAPATRGVVEQEGPEGQTEPSVEAVRSMRQQVNNERQDVAASRQEMQQTIERELQDLSTVAEMQKNDTVQAALNGIQNQGPKAVETAGSVNLVDLQI
ncbi:MAG: hypothetical protein HOC74_40345 [Gemmatimonadetes bacterium]|jgi:hypothetical protein|nr:hypothetical protein [Gemmatimonadota bacterium]